MSHFSVLVIGADYKEQLAPYQENSMGNCPQKYLTFYDCTEEVLTAFEGNRTGAYNAEGNFVHSSEPEFKKLGAEAISLSLKEIYPDLGSFARAWANYVLGPDGKSYGYYENPNAKWDWCVPGGRFADYFETANQPAVNSLRAGQVNWDAMRDQKLKDLNERWSKFLKWLDNGKPRNILPYYTFGVAANKESATGFETYEQFISKSSSIAPFAFVKDGVWCESGEMGWWAVVSNATDPLDWDAQFRSVIAGLDHDELLTIVDCHI